MGSSSGNSGGGNGVGVTKGGGRPATAKNPVDVSGYCVAGVIGGAVAGALSGGPSPAGAVRNGAAGAIAGGLAHCGK